MSQPSLKKEQLDAVNHNRGDVLVSASAGSGKTFVMISRAVRLVCEGLADVDEILAVTFTEMAALEMKEKLKKELIKKINETKDQRLTKQLALLPTADISTLHSFCGRLVRTYFFECGVSPDFSIADETDATALKNTAIDRLFNEKYQALDTDFLNVLKLHRYKRSDAKFKQLILTIFKFCESESCPEDLLDRGIYYCTKKGFDELLKTCKINIDNALIKIREKISELEGVFLEKPKLENLRKQLVDDLEEILNSDDAYVIKKFFEYKRDFTKIEKSLSEEETKGKNLLKECRDLIKKCLERYNEYLTDRETDQERCVQQGYHLGVLSQLVKGFTEIYSELKRDENLLDFADLEHFALKILSNEEIRKAVCERYKYIFIDEYQDTNGVQEKLVSLIISDNLFMVGDVKQSIYGFRGCRPEFFQAKFNAMDLIDGATIKLNHNFRSSSAVIDMVNRVFNYSMTKETFGLDYKNTAQLIDGGIYPSEQYGRAKLHFLHLPKERSKEKEEPRIYNILEEIKESDDDISETSALIANIINDELGKKYYDIKSKDGGSEKEVTLKDIAILTRSKTAEHFRAMLSGLIKRGIEVETEAVDDVCDYPEIQVLVSVLKLVDCFVQDVPLAIVLKSVIGGFSDEDLAEISFLYSDYCKQNKTRPDSFYDAYVYCKDNLNTLLGKRLRDFHKEFSDLRKLADFTSAGTVLEKVMERHDFKACLYASPFGESKVRRVERFVSASNKNGKNLSVKEFLSYVETDGNEINLSECSGDNAVKIMTIHASKGLEYPVVIVYGLERRANDQEEKDEVYLDRLYGLGVKYYDKEEKLTYETLFRGIVKDHMRSERRREELRLFYVALTRAKYSLHMTFVGGDMKRKALSDANRFIDYVPEDVEYQTYTLDDLVLTNTKTAFNDGFGALPVDQNVVTTIKRNFEYVYPYLPDTKLPLKTSVTGTLKQQEQDSYSIKELFKESENKTDTERGTIAHKLLEVIDFNVVNDFDGEINRIVSNGVITKEDLDKIDLLAIKRVIESQVFEKIKGKRIFKEKSFIAQVPSSILFDNDVETPVLVQGVIDLLVIDGDKATVIDYKYSARSAEKLKETYSKQLEIYSYVVENVLNLKVDSRAIVSLLTGECITID